jgi:phytoene desaturase
MSKKISIIGSGFSSLTSACYLAKQGYDVSVFEKNSSLGGRARQFKKDGFTFDMGPSWYWMPDVFERFFKDFGKTRSDFYSLERLNSWLQSVFDKETQIQIVMI